ncbi:lipopolysaccharide transport periplasmic protein LptA [Caenibius tardaugens]|nr:lipopolysaccharide transport periplasmic protein LptA [Caenibius tardaugens NBRC 16725]TXH15703.1 MAG: lipopolysaccharide transport periplasmic protein LptA [Gammaproteobacteria bacterium]
MKRHAFTSLRYAAAGFVLTLTAMGGVQLYAQALKGHNTKAPVNFAADRIELQDRQDRVVLSGNVDITQGELRLKAARTTVDYTNAGSLTVQRITATGGVNVTRGTESAQGNVGIYDFNNRVITLVGNVALRRGGDTLNGQRLTMDLDTGVSSVDGRGGAGGGTNGGRVTGTFSVPG